MAAAASVLDEATQTALTTVLADYPNRYGTETAIVLAVDDLSADVYLRSVGVTRIGVDAIDWARAYISDTNRGDYPTVMGDVLAPGVILNRDPGVHLRNLQTTPPIEEEATACVECGMCEPVCPSRNTTTTPRQRILLRREMARQPQGSPVLEALLDSPNLGSKAWIVRQYDSLVQGSTAQGPGGDAAVVRVKRPDGTATRLGLALAVDCNPRLCWLDPYGGSVAAVAWSAVASYSGLA